MKNEYYFNLLVKKEIPPNKDHEDIFFKMFEFVMGGTLYESSSLDSLKDILCEESYYIAHNLVTYKGNKAIFKGKVVASEKENLVSFLYKSAELDDLRALLIAPIFNEKPKYVIYLTEDSCHFYHKN
ncbi:hypothetical protein BDD26_1415 [Xenorhabdus cabanillasii]|uniref:Uncharacterized protein n=1 Tax=Xenorhabdus cabanillasii TaxID=351673 RepID=A0A3D9UED0_9GAMM|nr:hypothetical protein [Xenorhabdus cabanillasii]REF26733.1 hypothetical protein BDD26_1415 [Xenorhabdus cabanillasii]